jgi:glycine cleavage system transcriptional repressor
MTRNLRVAISCPDQTGLVAAITGRLFDLGGNLADTSFAVLGGAAEFTSVVEMPADAEPDAVAADLSCLPALQNAVVDVTPFELDPVHGPIARITHRVAVSGGDRPGLIARLSEVLAQYGANIVRLDAERIPGPGGVDYVVLVALHLPPATAAACLAAVANTAGSLALDSHWETVAAPAA